MTDTAKMDSAERLAELADLAGASREKVLAKLEAGGALALPRPAAPVTFAPSGASKVTAAEKARRRAKGKAQRKARARSRRYE